MASEELEKLKGPNLFASHIYWSCGRIASWQHSQNTKSFSTESVSASLFLVVAKAYSKESMIPLPVRQFNWHCPQNMQISQCTVNLLLPLMASSSKSIAL